MTTSCVQGSGIATVTGPQLALPHSLAKWTCHRIPSHVFLGPSPSQSALTCLKSLLASVFVCAFLTRTHPTKILIGFFGDLIWSRRARCHLYPSVMSPRAPGKGRSRHVSWANHRLWFFLDGCLRSFIPGFVRSRMRFPWLVLVWGRNGSGWVPQTCRTRCVWGRHARHRPMSTLDAHGCPVTTPRDPSKTFP